MSAIPLLFFLKAEKTDRNPSEAQIKAGNYAKRKIPWRGMTISVENEAGSVRSGTDPNGKPWRVKMRHTYGYLNRTEGVDGDHVDVYLGPDIDKAPMVYVVHQRKYGNWKAYDEDKAMLGFRTKREAVRAFLSCYNDRRFLGPVTAMTVEDFIEKAKATFDKPKMIKSHVKAHDRRLPSGKVVRVKAHEDGRTKRPARQLIGKGSSGEVYREGQETVKNATGHEAAIYAALSGMEGVAPGYEKDGKIRTPYYERVISIDTIPKDERESYAGLIEKNAARINQAVMALTDAGYYYNDPLQFGLRKDGKLDLLDFSAASNNFPKEVRSDNAGALATFYRMFGLSDLANAVSTVNHVLDIHQLGAKDEAFRPLLWGDREEGIRHNKMLRELGGGRAEFAYLRMKGDPGSIPGAAQFRTKARVAGVLTKEPLADDVIARHGLLPVVHPTGRSGGKRKESQAMRGTVPETDSGVTPDTSPEFDYLRDKTLAERKRVMAKSITLILPSGNEYPLNQSQYRWQVSNLLLKALGPGERWITVHPSGNKDAKGVPVLVRESQTGSGVYSVIGGAGGKLNYLKLRGIRPESDYKAQARERAASKRQAKREQAQQARESGMAGVKNAQREAVSQQQRQQEAQFVEQVAKVMGWDEKDYKFDGNDHRNLSEAAMRKAADRHHRDVLQRAMEAVEVQRERLIADPDLRAAAGLDHLPKHSDMASQLSVADIDPVTPPGTTLGFAPKYEQRAAAAGASPEAIKQEAEAVKDARLTPEQREAAIKRGETREAVKKELEDIRQPATENLKIELVEAQQAVELLKMKKQLRAVQQQAQAARADIDKDQSGKVKAYHLTVGDEPDLDDKVKSDLENDIRTAQTRAFLSTVRETGGKDYEQALNAAIGAGSFNSINALAITAGGAALVDRSVVDVLGPAGAAQVLARRLHADLDAETVDKLVTDFEDFHLHHYMDTSKAALDQAANLQAEAKKLQIDEASDATDLALAKSLTEKRMKAIAESQRLLGTALGEMEANAALVAALKAGRTDTPLEVPLGGISPEDAIRQCRAIGLQRGDYRLDKVDGNEILTVTPEGLDRLAKPVDVAEVKRARRNLDIIEGREDEDNWLPKGVANRPDLAMPPVNPGVADVLAKPFSPGDDLEQSLRDYIGGRMADGDAPADILADVQSATFFDKAGQDRFDEYRAALDAVAPLKDAKGTSRPIESLRPDFEALADEFVERHYGGERSPLHRQTFDPNDTAAAESLYRSLAEVPEGIAAYKPIGELTPQDQRALRDYFHANVAREDENAAELRHQLEDLSRAEPEKAFEDMFGEVAENPEWREWKNQRDSLAEQVNQAKLSWDTYVTLQRGQANAYASLQDLIKSRVTETFIDHYNRAHADKPLKVGRTVIRNHLAHADAIDPALREARLEEQRQFNARLQARNAGKFASDDVIGKQQAAREADEALRQAQFSLFGDEEAPEVQSTPLRADERHTLGHAAENQISRMVPMMARNFKPGQPFQMWQPSMNGKGVARQRAVKHILANKRTVLAAGVGSGKTLITLSAFAHLHETGKAKKAIFITPSAVQSQFRGEAARYLDPQANGGKGFTWHIEPGASREERLAAYRDPETHFSVVTHQAFRDDMLHLGAEQAGISQSEMATKLDAMSPQDRRAWGKQTMEKAGIHWDYIAADEAQAFLNRQGKANSQQANVLDSITPHSEYYVSASADPVKNSVDEAYDLLAKMDPERYTDRDAFMRSYGNETPTAKEALRREMARYWFPSSVDPGVETRKGVEQVDLKPEQSEAIKTVEKLTSKARLARMEGRVDLESLKALSPSSFEGVPDDQHEKVGQSLLSGLGMVKTAAVQRIIDAHPEGAKLDRISALAAERKGKPGVIFAHSLDAVKAIEARLKAEGHRVVTLTGADSTKEKEAKRMAFQPESGEAKADILVASDAAATGLNLQRGAWLVQNDTSPTAMVHAQRNGRIARQGQLNPNIELIDLVAQHPAEQAARDRLQRKYQLRELMTSPMAGMDDTGLAYFLKQRDSQQAGLF